ncbi:MAG: YdbL family protein [Gammaproteobacteria bacterium]|nr:YdbL family protein [Gammaproteobacteria bacterium]NIR97116.1 YdbL family protein [Gammaproteobacteria bacterium]NIT62819.1 YdbL family protein [Gammaproteobacteria bacterium]NIV19784.1 DUF1318 domain-containing protein [Gammaproteobacteria bacterium]NIX11228.1 DUF1318 domain-containing protein [Gammaproteobacteria bacterium]
MRHRTALPVLLTPLVLAACVTINVYFPAAAAERAADRFIQDVYGKQPEQDQPENAPSQEPAQPSGALELPRRLGRLALDILVPPARAAADIDVNTPAIQAIKRSMQQRQSKLGPYYSSGAIGMTADGLITIRDPGAVPLRERNRLRSLVTEENRDRNTLYREIAKANGHPEWQGQIRKTFAQRWVANAPGGWWYQDGAGNWKRK